MAGEPGPSIEAAPDLGPVALGVQRVLALVPGVVAVPASRHDVRWVVAAAFASGLEVLCRAAQMRRAALAVEAHRKAAVEALAALAVESELS